MGILTVFAGATLRMKQCDFSKIFLVTGAILEVFSIYLILKIKKNIELKQMFYPSQQTFFIYKKLESKLNGNKSLIKPILKIFSPLRLIKYYLKPKSSFAIFGSLNP